MNFIKIKGVFDIENSCFKVVSLQEKITKAPISAQLLLKMMYHLQICIYSSHLVIHELNFRKYGIAKLNLANIFIRKDQDSPDVFIDQKNISEQKEINQFKQFINILKQLGINPLLIKQMKDEKQCSLILLAQLGITENDQVSLLKKVYHLEFTKNIYGQNGVLVCLIKTPYYIDAPGQDELAIKVKLDKMDDKLRTEIDTLLNLQWQKSKNFQPDLKKKVSQLFCYSCSPISEKVLFQEKYEFTLRSFIENHKGKISKRDKILLCRKMADALKSLHYQKIIHRDIKPENIMVSRINQNQADSVDNLQCTLIDFDVSKGKDQQQEEFFQSTLAYRPPEGQEVNYAESFDICQLGLTFLFIVQEEDLEKYPRQERPYPTDKYERAIRPGLDNVKNLCPELYLTIQEMIKYDPKERISLQQVFSRLGEKLQN